MMLFGIFITFFAGYPHIWSIYQPYAMEVTGWSQSQASMCFYLALATFVFGSIFGGRLQDRYHPRIAILIGGGLLAAGILLSAAALRESPLYAYLTYGVMQGTGQGMIYTTVVSTAQKWFPEKTGFASGLIVMADALCGFVMAPVSKVLLERQGIRETFLIVGVLIAAAWIPGCIFIKNPQETEASGYRESAEEAAAKRARVQQKKAATKKGDAAYQYTSKEMMKTKQFYFLVATMFFGLISYLIVSPISQTVQLERGIPGTVAVSAVMFGSICNAAARLVLPSVSDRIGRIPCLKGVLLVQVAAMALLIAAPSYFTTAAVVLIYGSYGGIMGSFPSLTSSIFGIRYSGENYGFVMSGLVIATLLIPVLTNRASVNGYGMNVLFIVGLVCAGAALACLLRLVKCFGEGGESWKQ